MREFIITPSETVALPILKRSALFPVRRVYCVARNYEAHAREMGFDEREQPFFFMKPADAIVASPAQTEVAIPYPSLTEDLHHEVELVVVLGQGGRDLTLEQAQDCIFGYAVGLDMTRRDLQMEMKKHGRPWDIAKGFDASAPIGPITPREHFLDANLNPLDIHAQTIALSVNGLMRQHSPISLMIWNVYEIICALSRAWELRAGDVIFTGTPEGVASVARGDLLQASVSGLTPLSVRIT